MVVTVTGSSVAVITVGGVTAVTITVTVAVSQVIVPDFVQIS
ncbi:exported hypothetical protein [Capnocytophaga canis]|uniref:Uncharacterized protein n=1 Tax=Capnocytophaga canis TaxID=1848903 RepID=A0A0B7IRI7_9FLAO|nr:exported hypothetical protein [Capnocytophaga canis]